MDRRLTLRVALSDLDGGQLGSGETTLEYPSLEAAGKHIQRRRARPQDRLFGAVAGMREGGDREFLWRSDLHHPDDCEPRDGRCWFPISGHPVAYPPDQDVLVRVQLDRLCAPRYCLVTTYSIPLSASQRLVETSCR
jgi:hypothetical protein